MSGPGLGQQRRVAVSNQEYDIIAIIPMKPLTEGKSRLAQTLSPEQRANISMGMLRRVLTALKGAFIDPIWVVGGDERVKNLARNQGAIWHEEMGHNLNDTLGKAFEQAFLRGRSALYIAGDLPFVKPSGHSFLHTSIPRRRQYHPCARQARWRHQCHADSPRDRVQTGAGTSELQQASVPGCQVGDVRRHRPTALGWDWTWTWLTTWNRTNTWSPASLSD